ncbi:cytochrome P450 [Xylaria digitata]|nr:cytochrome P450 [Xylaria digitata]
MLASFCVGAGLAYVIWTIACLEANVYKATALKVSIVRLPIDSNNIIWILLQPHVWKIGPVWALVTPVAINIHFADPDVIRDIVTRRGDFQRPIAELKLLELYGPCISTAKWEEWPRHRKVMATHFNETVVKPVWDESLHGISSYQKDTRALSLNVLAATGFGKTYDFRASTEPQDDEVGGYRDSLQTVLDNIILLMLVPFNILCMLPKSWARIGNAGISFQKHMVKMLEDEIFGNLFVINFAGHDTTANTLAFGVLLLAAHPDVQAWLAEEIAIVTGNSSIETWDYKALLPQLKRCRAIMYEVLRLYPPVPAMPSIAPNHAQVIEIGSQTLNIPEGVNLTVNLRAMQVHLAYWADANDWLPSQWISDPAPAVSPTADQIAGEKLVVPSKSVFFPWGEGPQICPGKKFVEVQAVAVLACLFKTHRLEVKKISGESDSVATKRAKDCSNDVDLEMLVRMRDADRVTLICREA